MNKYCANHGKKLFTIDSLTLSNREFPERQFVIEELLLPGVYVFAGSPKVGKSLLVFSMALAISSGAHFWNRRTQKGTVLYLALEDGLSRI